jgi:hypothetical protein
MQAIASLPQLSRLTVLRLSNNSLGSAGVRALATSPHLNRLSDLHLRWNDIDDAGIQVLAVCPCLSRLAHLDLSVNDIGDAGALALAESLPHLTALVLYWNPIGEEARRGLEEHFGPRVKLGEPGGPNRFHFHYRG